MRHCGGCQNRPIAHRYTWPYKCICTYPCPSANSDWPCSERERGVEVIVRSGTKVCSLRHNRTLPNADRRNVVTNNPPCKRAEVVHIQIPWCPDLHIGVDVGFPRNLCTKKSQKTNPQTMQRRWRPTCDKQPSKFPKKPTNPIGPVESRTYKPLLVCEKMKLFHC